MHSPEFEDIMGHFEARFGGGKAINETDLLDEFDSNDRLEMVITVERILHSSYADIETLLKTHMTPRMLTNPSLGTKAAKPRSSSVYDFVEAAIRQAKRSVSH